MSRANKRAAALAGALLISALPAESVSSASCSIQLSSLNFGIVRSSSSRPADSTATLSGRCLAPVSFRVLVDHGRASGLERQLARGAARLRYDLYLDAARTQVWGDGTRGSAAHQVRVSGAFTITVFGRVHAGQSVPPGVYSDSLLVTIEY